MHLCVDWKLLNNDEVVIFKENVLCEYILDKELILKEDDGVNRINFEQQVYERSTDEFKMIIDFKENIGKFILNDKEDCSFNIKGSFENNDDIIRLSYALDDEIKTIVITRKGMKK